MFWHIYVIVALHCDTGEPLPGMPGSQVGPVPIICMYGVTMDGNSIAAYVHGFAPYFYIPAGPGFQPDDCAAFRVSNQFGEIIAWPISSRLLCTVAIVDLFLCGFCCYCQQTQS